ncbi:MAG: LysE family transporter [SAR324 cluster bacterium]|nr:LysE family transporter [SAR324 cluster bacterium]
MLGITNIYAFIFASFLAILLPGPNSLYIISISFKQGRRQGIYGVLGVISADLIYMILVSFGAISFLKAYPDIFDSVRLVGAIYLGWIGVKFIYDGIRKKNSARATQVEEFTTKKKTANYLVYYKCLLIGLLNPKAMIFFFTIFTQFIDPSYKNLTYTFLFQVMIVQLITGTYFITLVLVSAKITKSITGKGSLRSIMQVLIGAVLFGYGLMVGEKVLLK